MTIHISIHDADLTVGRATPCLKIGDYVNVHFDSWMDLALRLQQTANDAFDIWEKSKESK